MAAKFRSPGYSLPWLDEERELLLALWHKFGPDYERIRVEMEKDGWERTAKAIKGQCPPAATKAITPRHTPIGFTDPMQIFAVCKPWRKKYVPKSSAVDTTE